MHEHDEEITVIQHTNGFPMIKTTIFEKKMTSMFFQVNVNKSFTKRFQVRGIWSFVARYDPRGRQVKYIVYEEYDIE
jgi:hypothetical protein